MQTGETLIEVKDLCKHFRDGTVKALDGIFDAKLVNFYEI